MFKAQVQFRPYLYLQVKVRAALSNTKAGPK